MAVATALALLVSPPTKTFVDGISSPSLWAGLQHRLLPEHKWFGFVPSVRQMAEPIEASSDLTTGSIPPPPAAADATALPAAGAPAAPARDGAGRP
jgi:hypothetical protein